MTPRGPELLTDVAAVVIGRNEGERLRRCLLSLTPKARLVVYVDSGSTDGSAETARTLGARVVELDARVPFTAARARNVGFDEAIRIASDLACVQFVDGDCEVEPGWLEAARAYIAEHPQVAVVFGRRRERHPERSVFNRLCDREWSVPPGKVKSCGGDAMIRADALRQSGGYRSNLIAGEEPELCVRLRANGWTIICLDRPMTRHDAAMTRFSQWWRRAKRSGYAFAQGAHIHGAPPERHWVVETRRAWIWGIGIPASVVVAAVAAGPIGLLPALVYPAQIARLYFKRRTSQPVPLASSAFDVLAKFPEALGQVTFYRDLLCRRTGALIEYK